MKIDGFGTDAGRILNLENAGRMPAVPVGLGDGWAYGYGVFRRLALKALAGTMDDWGGAIGRAGDLGLTLRY